MSSELEMKAPAIAQPSQEKPTPKAPPTTKAKKAEPAPAADAEAEAAPEDREDPSAHLEAVSAAIDHPATKAGAEVDANAFAGGSKSIYQVSLPHNPAHFVEAPNRTLAQQLYAAFMGITGTTHKYSVVEASPPAGDRVVRLDNEKGLIELS